MSQQVERVKLKFGTWTSLYVGHGLSYGEWTRAASSTDIYGSVWRNSAFMRSGPKRPVVLDVALGAVLDALEAVLGALLGVVQDITSFRCCLTPLSSWTLVVPARCVTVVAH